MTGLYGDRFKSEFFEQVAIKINAAQDIMPAKRGKTGLSESFPKGLMT